jgi:hypothetical protein
VDPAGWTETEIGDDLETRLRLLPARPGVGVLRGPEGRALLVGAPANLRRWAASHLGLGRPPRPGRRPRTNLRGIARSLSIFLTRSPFHQRLTFERAMSQEFPGAPRRDLRPPFYLRLDLGERFPRARVVPRSPGASGLHGPFRDRRAAERASAALHARFPLRPCDYVFEPDPALPLGLGCLFAQVASCPAPCLARVPEDEYRALATQARAFLADPEKRRDPDPGLPAWIGSADGTRAVVAELVAGGIEVVPVSGPTVLDEQAVLASPEALESAIASLRFEQPDSPRDDSPWLSAWLHSRRRTGAYVVLGPGGPSAAAEQLVAALGVLAE